MLIERLVLHEGKRVVLFAPKATKEGVWEPHLREWLPHIGVPAPCKAVRYAIPRRRGLSTSAGRGKFPLTSVNGSVQCNHLRYFLGGGQADGVSF